MEAPRNILTNVLHLAATLLLLASCYNYANYPQKPGLSIRLHWNLQSSGTTLLKPDSMCYVILPVDTVLPQIIQGTSEGCDVRLPVGTYRALIYSTAVEGLYIEYPADYAQAVVRAKLSTSANQPGTIVREDDVMFGSAGTFWASWIDNASVEEDVNTYYYVTPSLLASCVTIKIDNQTRHKVTTVSGVLRGLVAARRIVGGRAVGRDMGAFLFRSDADSNASTPPVTTIACLGLFNPDGSAPYQNLLSTIITFDDGSSQIDTKDISDMLAAQMREAEIATNVEIVLSLTSGAGGDVNVDVSISVNGWNDGGHVDWTD